VRKSHRGIGPQNRSIDPLTDVDVMWRGAGAPPGKESKYDED
jgi:hypothetical protein